MAGDSPWRDCFLDGLTVNSLRPVSGRYTVSDVERTIAALRDLGNPHATDSVGPTLLIDPMQGDRGAETIGRNR